MLEEGWTKVYHPAAAVYHAHDYGPVEFMRRYFDEYRGLRETIGHVEPISARGLAGTVRRQVSGDRGWMREQGYGPSAQARWTVRSAAHHAGRGIASALGSRAERLPAPLQRAFSLERRAGAQTAAHVEPARRTALDRRGTGWSVRGPRRCSTRPRAPRSATGCTSPS